MSSRTVTEWHCDRCGTEEALPSHKPNQWQQLIGLMDNSVVYRREKTDCIGGDLCPDCVASLWAWWILPRQPRLVAPAEATP